MFLVRCDLLVLRVKLPGHLCSFFMLFGFLRHSRASFESFSISIVDVTIQIGHDIVRWWCRFVTTVGIHMHICQCFDHGIIHVIYLSRIFLSRMMINFFRIISVGHYLVWSICHPQPHISPHPSPRPDHKVRPLRLDISFPTL